MMKSKSTKYAHQSSRSLNLDIPNPSKCEWSVSPAIRYVIIDSIETYMWDLVTVKNSHELLVEFPMYIPQPTTGPVVNNTTLFLHVSGSNPCHGKLFSKTLFRDLCLHVGPWNNLWWLGTFYFRKKAYMWDPTEFYDDWEHSILK
jgi:hypothetical protein